jgi:opacity protein-like surface antigen
MPIKKLIESSIIASLVFASQTSLAGFSTYSENWPDDASVVDEKVTKVNLTTPQTPKDENEPPCAISAINTDSMDDRVPEQNHLYVKFGAVFVSSELRKISNTSSPALSSASVAYTSAKDNYLTWEAGFGTRYKWIRLELEYLYEKTMQYNPSPVFTGLPESLSSTYTNQSVWLDIIYDFNKLNFPYFTPYVGALGGFAWNKTRSTLYGGVGNGLAETHNRYGLAWGVTAGIRVPFWTRWFGYVGYKYLDQGMARYLSSTGTMGLKANSVVQGVNIGVQYILG